MKTTSTKPKKQTAPSCKTKSDIQEKDNASVSKKIAVIDTETNVSDEVMSVGLVIADSATLKILAKAYYIITPEYAKGGIYYDRLDMRPYKMMKRKDALAQIDLILSKNQITSLYAYNACFDCRQLPELSSYNWYDIMRVAAYKQYNPRITDDMPICATGRLKKGYGVEDMIRLLSDNNGYRETHNALSDAEDELKIMKLLRYKPELYPCVNGTK